MGKLADFVCSKCGFRALVSMYQPDVGFFARRVDRFCPERNKIVSVYETLMKLTPSKDDEKPDKVCAQCTKRPDGIQRPSKTCTEELVILAEEKGPGSPKITAYRCPIHGCGGTMEVDPDGRLIYWD